MEYTLKNVITSLFMLFTITCHAQKPANGTYNFKIAYGEWQGRSTGETCIVKIKGDSITVFSHSAKNGSTQKEEILDIGILMKHTRTGKWIIAHSPSDISAKDIGGCSDGPAEIDLKRKVFWQC